MIFIRKTLKQLILPSVIILLHQLRFVSIFAPKLIAESTKLQQFKFNAETLYSNKYNGFAVRTILIERTKFF